MTTLIPTTVVPTTEGLTTAAPTTEVPTTVSPTTDVPVGDRQIRCARTFRYPTREMFVRAWVANGDEHTREDPLEVLSCWAELFAETISRGRVIGEVDLAGAHYVAFRLPQIPPQPSHGYFLRIHLETLSGTNLGERDFPMGTT